MSNNQTNQQTGEFKYLVYENDESKGYFKPQSIDKYFSENNTHKYVEFKNMYFFVCPGTIGNEKNGIINVKVNLTPSEIKNRLDYEFRYDLNKNFIDALPKKVKLTTSKENIENLKEFIQQKVLDEIIEIRLNYKKRLFLKFKFGNPYFPQNNIEAKLIKSFN